MQTSEQLWQTIERVQLLPTVEAKQIHTRWFRPGRAGADDPVQFGRWLVTNSFLTKFALEQIDAGKAETLRLGPYLLQHHFPAGPHAGAYQAADALGRKVLIDLVDDALAADAQLVRAFEAAAERAMAVQHPHVNRVVDFGHAHGRYYLVREYDDGVALDEVLARRSRLAAEPAARLFAQAFAGLGALHEKQVQGGDLGPGCLLLATLGKKGRAVKILRPGFPAALFSGGRVEEIVGLLRPLARPEDDLFRLGQTFYLSLTGQPSGATLAGGSARPLRELVPDLPELLTETVEQLLSADVAARPRFASRVAKTLRVYLASSEPAKEARAEEEIAAPADIPQPPPAEEPEKEPEDTAAQPAPQSRLAALWEEFRPQPRELFFLAGGAVGVIVLVLLIMLVTGIHFINIVCLLAGAALSFFAERLFIHRQRESE
jgi:serine/threonine-protein kinase